MFLRTASWFAILILFTHAVLAAVDKPGGDIARKDKPPAADWPIFRGSPTQTGVAASALPDNLEILWRFKTGDAIEGTAAIVGGVAYVGSFDEHLYAIDLATGKEKWKYKAAPFKAAVSVREGRVYAGDIDGEFHCLEAATGKKLWSFKTDGEITSGANFAADAILFGSSDEHVYCLTKDGKRQWKFKIAGGPVNGSPAIIGDRAFVAGCDSALHVIDVSKGKGLNSIELGGPVGATSAILGEQLYVGTMDNHLAAVDWKQGQIVWKYEPKRAQAFFASAAVTDTLVVTGNRDKRVHAVDRKTGKPVWTFDTEGKVDSSPVIAGKRVLVGSVDGHLYVLDLMKGTLLKKIDLGGPISASPAVGAGCVVIGTEKGFVYCLGGKK
jgi:outer membrane protein assembly factor BamB